MQINNFITSWDSIPSVHNWGVDYNSFTEVKPKEHIPFNAIDTNYSDIIIVLISYIFFMLIVNIIKNGRIHREDKTVEGGQ